MERRHIFIFLIFLLATVVASFATELIITPSGPVHAGSVLHFSAVIEDTLGDCTVNPGQHGPLYVGNETNVWRTEGIIPAHNSGTQTYIFQTTYTVTAADMENPDFCFYLLHGAMNCWAQGHVFAQKCPQKQQTLTVVSPNGGEAWPAGQVRNITWNADWKGMVQLGLYQNKVFKGVIAVDVPSLKGSFPWHVGATNQGTFTGKGFKVTIVRQYRGLLTPRFALADESDGVFAIVPQFFKPMDMVH
jgi:hypothetical protein